VAKRRKTKRRKKLFSPSSGSSKKRTRRKARQFEFNLMSILKVLGTVIAFSGIAVGFVFMALYVRNNKPVSEKTGLLELVKAPVWINEELSEKIYTAATASGEDLKLDEDAARSVQQNIEYGVAWVDNVRVQVTSERFLISARWRKPLALVKMGLSKCYVDSELVVLDYVPMSKLPIVQITGAPLNTELPQPGQIWNSSDITAAVAILDKLDRRDNLNNSQRPLLYEIGRIDVSNYGGRENSRASHIILYTTDNIEILWGAELGAWQRHLEATDEEKIAKLYSYYTEYGTLLGGVKYINLCDPRDNIPLPIDKY